MYTRERDFGESVFDATLLHNRAVDLPSTSALLLIFFIAVLFFQFHFVKSNNIIFAAKENRKK